MKGHCDHIQYHKFTASSQLELQGCRGRTTRRDFKDSKHVRETKRSQSGIKEQQLLRRKGCRTKHVLRLNPDTTGYLHQIRTDTRYLHQIRTDTRYLHQLWDTYSNLFFFFKKDLFWVSTTGLVYKYKKRYMYLSLSTCLRSYYLCVYIYIYIPCEGDSLVLKSLTYSQIVGMGEKHGTLDTFFTPGGFSSQHWLPIF